MKRKAWVMVICAAILAIIGISGGSIANADAANPPWSGAGTESNPWKITSAADLVALRDYLAATEGATQGKYFLQTADISLSSVCGASIGDFMIGVREGNSYDTHVFDGTYNGGGHTITDLYIGNGGDGAGLFAELETHGKVKNLSVSGYVNGGEDVGGIVGYGANPARIENCSFNGTVTGVEDTGGIAGFMGTSTSIENCSFSGSVTGTSIYTGGISGYSKGSMIDCVVNGNITGSNNSTGGIVGCCYAGVIQNCTFQSGTVNGVDWTGGIAGLGNAQLIDNCKFYGTVTGHQRVGGIAGETCGPIQNCENHGAVSANSYAGGITGHSFAGMGYTGAIDRCKNYGDITTEGMFVGGIVAYAEGPVSNCSNYGEVRGTGYTGSIVGDGNGGTQVTLKSNGGAGDDVTSQIYDAPACPFTHSAYGFFAWNTKADGSGTYYKMGDGLPSNNLTLYAIWMSQADTSYSTLDGEEETVQSALLNTAVQYLPGGWFTVQGDMNLPGRLYLSGDVNLILPAGKTLTCAEGINVPSGSSLTIWAGYTGAGTLNATGPASCAGIGGGEGQACGTVTVNGGTVTATGGSGAAGIGGGEGCSGGSFTLNDGTVTAKGGNYGAGVGGGDEGSGGTVVVNGGTLTARGKNGAAGIGGGDYGNGGNVTINGGTVRAYGSTRSNTGQAAAGIGAGRPKADGSSPRYRGKFTFVDGDLLAAAGTPSGSGLGAQALGVNLADADESMNQKYSTELLLCTVFYRITAGDSESAATLREIREFGTSHARELACAMMPFVHIEECHDHTFDENNGWCIYCGMNAAGGTAAGTADDPVLIRNADNWNHLAAMMADGYDSTGKYFRLTGSISVSVMLGTAENPFKGHFDGAGHTLTVNIEDAGLCAPFRGISSAEIVNLKAAGSVKGANHSAGLAAAAFGTNLIENCVVSAGVTTTGTHCGGFIGHGGTSNTTIKGCVFSGSISGASHAGTFWGWSDSGAQPHIQDCLDVSASKFPIGVGSPDGGSSVVNTYYRNPNKIAGASRPWSYRGDLARSVTAGESVTVDFGEGTSYSVSGLTAHAAGLTYGGVFYAGEDQLVAITISCSLEEPELGYTRVYTASSGTLTVITDSFISLIVGSGDCVITAGNLSAFQGSGTQDDPFLISAAEDWAALGEQVENGFDTAGKYFLLTNSISVNTPVGSSLHRFKGDFNGGGNTLVVTLRATGTDPAAPFGGILSATIRNLAVQGSVVGGNYTAGLAAYASGVNLIENCAINALVQASASRSGGVIGNGSGSFTTIMGCVFSGALNESSDSAVFWGWSDVGKAVLINCVDFSGSSRPLGLGNGEVSVTNTYYCLDNKTLASEGPWSGSNGGRLAYGLIPDTGVTVSTGLETACSVSGITAGLQGIRFHGTLLLGEGETVTLYLTCDVPEGSVLTGYTASAGQLEQINEINWSITMPGENVRISRALAPAFGEPDFTLPAALTQIEAEAFEGIGAAIVDIPPDCALIGDHAFRSCTSLTMIRIPADCVLGEDVFDGCTLVYVYGSADSSAERYCEEHENCVFVEER